MRRSWLIVVFTVFLMYSGICHAQGTLGNIRNDIEDSSSDDENHSNNRRHHHHCHDDDDDDSLLGAIIGGIFFGGSSSRTETVTTETVYVTDQPEPKYEPEFKNQNYGFAAYPYPLGMPGYLFPEPVIIPEGFLSAGEVLDQKLVSMRVLLENGNNFSGLNRFNGTLEAELAYVLGIRTSWNYFYEDLPRGRSDDAVLGNVTPTIRLVGTEKLLVRVGLGFWIFTDDRLTESGVNAHLSADYFPVRPLVFSGMLEGGGIGDTGIFHLRMTAGALFKGIEFFGGYDYMQIGNSNLHTPMIGMRLWF